MKKKIQKFRRIIQTYQQRRFLSIYSRGQINDKGCIEWTGGCDKDGYGHASYTMNKLRKTWKVHRLIYFLKFGEIPENMIVCHTCDNPSCFNLKHLFLGTHKDNTRDRENKGRSGNNFKPGEKNISSKLNEKIVLEIRKKYSEGLRVRDLVKYYNLNQPTISKIINRQRWKHI